MHVYDNQEFKKSLFFSTIMDPETRWGEEDTWIFFLVYFDGLVVERSHPSVTVTFKILTSTTELLISLEILGYIW